MNSITSSNPDNNNLFPVFLKLEKLRLLIVGGGYVGKEKLEAVIQNSPATSVKLVAEMISNDIQEFAVLHKNITLIEKRYDMNDLDAVDLVIAAVNDLEVSQQIQIDARSKRLLVNVADKPNLCDFYLSSVVRKGNLKVAISTNGKSPTIAKRLKDFFTDLLPDELDEILSNMQLIRESLHGDFSEKVKQLNDLTRILAEKQISVDDKK